jgi:subtilisin family serine protease
MKFTLMKLKSSLFSALVFVSAAVIDAPGEEIQPYAIPGRYIVVLKHGHGHKPADVATEHGVKTRHVFGHALHGFAADISAERLETLRQDPRIESIEPELQLFSSAQTLPTGVKRIGASVSPMAKIDGLDERINADIAILDTGIAPHPDLNIYTNVSFISGQSTDGNGHGTHVAGIAGAIDNGVGVVGVAPGARLWAIKVMDDTGSGTTGTIIQGIDFVTQNAGQIEVANLSFGGIGYSSALRTAISNAVAKGIVFVVAAGNDKRDVYGPDGIQNTADDSIPAAYPEVMTVSALYDLDGVPSADDALASFSNFSRSVVAGNPVSSPGAAIDLAAPGVNIASTYLNGAYATMSGTSMAAPHAAGAVALYIAAHARATNAAGVYAIRQALINSAKAQSAWGSANTQDPDGNHEGLLYVGNIAPPYNSPPAVLINTPGTGTALTAGSAVTFTGSASDPETGSCTASLVWTSSLDGQIGTGGSFSKMLSAGTHTITASVTDTGGKTGKATITVAVQNTAPVVTISTPTGGSSYNSGAAISFTGSATDAQDGSRTASLVWTSSLDGVIGSGGSFSKALSAGTHTITAKATDSAGLTGQASIAITVLSAPTLGVAVVTDKSSYISGNRVYVTATVTDGANRIAGATANLTLVTASGLQVAINTTTDSNGLAKFQYKISSSRDGIGSYTATVAASKSGYTSGSGSATFTVTR